ncbi:MAG: sulfatase [Acidobacteria bacterium]|nr:sulfatase [Acidobacteriota bacterium]
MPEARRAPAAVAALAPAILAAALLGCGGRAAASRPNVLLITVDTLRPDHLGCYGYRRRTSQHIDAVARRGVIFRQAITAAGRTVQSFPSILTGVYPTVHGLRYEGQSHEVLASRVTLTRLLRENGYRSFAVTQGLNVGLHRDFDIYDPDIYLDPEGKQVYVPARNDREATRKGAGWLRGRREDRAPFFLWMRYNAPHWPYDAPAPFTEAFDPQYRGAHTFNGEKGPGAGRGRIIFGKTRLPAREVEHAVAHYDGEVAYADLAVGDLLKSVEEMGSLDRTLVVITSDHGESLGEHDYFFEHGAYLYDPTVRVPLIMSLPSRLPSVVVVEEQVRTIDIMPTILEVVGLPVPEELQGVSLLARARGRGGHPPLLAYSESGRNFYRENPRQPVDGVAGKWRMIRSDAHKLIMIPDDPEPIWELYDLRADPAETRNIWGSAPEAGEPLRRALLEVLASDPGRDDRDEPPLPPDLEDHLRSLGYVGGGGSR